MLKNSFNIFRGASLTCIAVSVSGTKRDSRKKTLLCASDVACCSIHSHVWVGRPGAADKLVLRSSVHARYVACCSVHSPVWARRPDAADSAHLRAGAAAQGAAVGAAARISAKVSRPPQAGGRRARSDALLMAFYGIIACGSQKGRVWFVPSSVSARRPGEETFSADSVNNDSAHCRCRKMGLSSPHFR